MFYSVLMYVCLGTPGNYECTLSVRRSVSASIYKNSIDACTSDADSSVNEALMESGRRGFAFAQCVNQKDYTTAIQGARVAILEQGHKFKFSVYKAK